MKTVYAKHEPYTDGHLGKVITDMQVAGPPTIRCIEKDNKYYALEGSHRLAAANYLKLEPKLVIEIPEADETLDQFWNRISKELPEYTYDHVHILNLAKFDFK